MAFIDIVERLGGKLLLLEKPARFTGGEYGIRSKKDAPFQTVIAFPDLYEVGMSNKALKILYNRLNDLDGVSCERVFALPPAAEALFTNEGIPLYGLDNGLIVKDAALLLFTFGYELGITGILSILDMSGVPLRNADRDDQSPIVIAGGPCVSNPLPYRLFIDAFWIGEAEAGFFELVETLQDAKLRGASRAELLSMIATHPSVWVDGKKEARRAVDTDFSARAAAQPDIFPVPSIKPVQHHGSVEIMRGCPNGCRFCHAGIWYRPARQKQASIIMEETGAWIQQGGYNEISLSSLSSGDYQHIEPLIDALNTRYGNRRVSFQLPSLHVSTLSLGLLEKISNVRKSGLTFAVETSLDYRQLSINKQVTLAMVKDILVTAKSRGWKGAKFYFMIGLPDAADNTGPSEEDAIVDFMRELMRFPLTYNVNIGVFVPKPHTPYQWEGQLLPDVAFQKLLSIKERLRSPRCKVSFQDPFISMLEGILSRGDGRVGEWVEAAYRRGARLDAWSDFFKRDIWEAVLSEHTGDVRAIMEGNGTVQLHKQPLKRPLPWECIISGVGRGYLAHEKSASDTSEITLPCQENCTHPCGACDSGKKSIVTNKEFASLYINNNTLSGCLSSNDSAAAADKSLENSLCSTKINTSLEITTHRIVFAFGKKGGSVFLSHLNLVSVFQMALQRAGIDAAHTAGFNPMPRLDFAAPLALGITGEEEIATIDTDVPVDPVDFKRRLNAALPKDIRVLNALGVSILPGQKKHAPAALYAGAVYIVDGTATTVTASNEKTLKASFLAEHETLYGLTRKMLLARPGTEGEPCGYLDLYARLYNHS